MNLPSNTTTSRFTDIIGLRDSDIFPATRKPCIKTLREWTKYRRIPSHKVGHFVYYDLREVAEHIQNKLKIPARG